MPDRSSIVRLFALLLVSLAGGQSASLAADAKAARGELVFERDVRPLLKAHCFQCHGEDGQLEAGLDLRQVRSMSKGGESGPALVAGKSAESLIVERLRAGEMPPGEKKMPDDEVATIVRWIDAGSRTVRPESSGPASSITAEELAHWAFQPVTNPAVPQPKQADKVRNPVDAFLLERLEQAGLAYSPEAERETLIRRVYFDLWGLPPTPAEVEAFLTDRRPDAWERLVDRLLASPHYGERWGRLWLDVAGYADSDGASQKDAVREHAYLYRDYVLRSINEDKPFDRFLREQLAGDEMLRPPYTRLDAEEAERLIATGFLRMGPDGTSDPAVDRKMASNDVIAETIKIVSSSLLGMTVGCAQCHSHRYEPIPQADYYRLRAIFEPAYDWKKWLTPDRRLIPVEVMLTAETRAKIEDLDAEIKRLEAERDVKLTELAARLFEEAVGKLPAAKQAPLREAYRTAPENRSPEQRKLLAANPKLDITLANVDERDLVLSNRIRRKFSLQILEIKKRRPSAPHAQALTEVPGKIPSTHLFFRGDFNQPREAVHPGELSVLTGGKPKPIADDDPRLPTTGRRTAYVRHLTSGKHPLVARVLVNRVWLNHFGRGLVATPADFGIAGERPSHPELLDWLASRWVVDGWRLKPLHRLLVTSTAYRQSSRRTPELERVDPDNRLLGRMSVRRLEAEMVRDAILAVSGVLNPKMYGPPVPVSPDELGQIVIAVDTRDTTGRFTGKKIDLGDEVFRRSVYVQSRRSMPLEMLETFDAPRMAPNCELRTSSTAAPQSLMLLNNGFLLEQAGLFARSVREAAGGDLLAQLSLAWRRAYGRAPSRRQLDWAREFVAEQTNVFEGRVSAASGSKKDRAKKNEPVVSPADAALESFCQALLCSNQFLYVD